MWWSKTSVVQPPLSPSKIRFPIDILDLILDALWEEGWQVGHLTLVCASWRRRIQRIQLESLKVNHLKDLRSIAKRTASGELTGFGRHLRGLEVKMGSYPRWTIEEGMALLEALPYLAKVSLDLSTAHKSEVALKDVAAVVPVAKFVNIKDLTVYSDCDALLISTRILLSTTPNLESFTLSHPGLDKPDETHYQDATPFVFPFLTRLSLLQSSIFEYLEEIRLLSSSTLLRIDHLELKGLHYGGKSRPYVSVFDLHGIDGTKIKTLALRKCPPSLPQSMVMACPHVERLIITPSKYAITLPDSVSILEYDCAGIQEDQEVNLARNVLNWGRITKLCVIDADERILDLLNRGYLELPHQVAEIFVNGVKYAPSLHSLQTPLPLPLPFARPAPPPTRLTWRRVAYILVFAIAPVTSYAVMSLVSWLKKR